MSATKVRPIPPRVPPMEVFERTALEYAAASTAHGITYIFERGRWAIERVFWIIAVALALLFR